MQFKNIIYPSTYNNFAGQVLTDIKPNSNSVNKDSPTYDTIDYDYSQPTPLPSVAISDHKNGHYYTPIKDLTRKDDENAVSIEESMYTTPDYNHLVMETKLSSNQLSMEYGDPNMTSGTFDDPVYTDPDVRKYIVKCTDPDVRKYMVKCYLLFM